MDGARAATVADLGVVARLWGDALAELDGQRGGALLAGSLSRPDLERFVHDGLEDPERLFVLGLVEGYPLGLAAATCGRVRTELVANVDLVFVEPKARRVGVAESMISVVADWAAARGCVGIDAPALPGNRAAKAFFEGQGFLARLLIMHRPLRRQDG
jgi:GNAT superfamily N-acetyltransferase